MRLRARLASLPSIVAALLGSLPANGWAAAPQEGTPPEKSARAESSRVDTTTSVRRSVEPGPAPDASPVASPVEDDVDIDDRIRGRADAGLAFGVGLLPAPGLGLDAAIGFQWRQFSLSVEGRTLHTLNFSITPDHAAYAALGLGLLSLCYRLGSLPRPLFSFEFCPMIGAGRIFIGPVQTENQPHYYVVAEAHPFTVITGIRLPVNWQSMPTRAPFFYWRAFLEGDVGLLQNHVSFNNVPVWGDLPPYGLTMGLEFSVVVNEPRSWTHAHPDAAPVSVAHPEPRP